MSGNRVLQFLSFVAVLLLPDGKRTAAQPAPLLRQVPHVVTRNDTANQSAPLKPVEELRQLPMVTHAGEGPAWHADSRSLYFTGRNRITRLAPNGTTHVIREPSGGANGLFFDRRGRLLACEAANRRVTRTEADGSLTALAASFDGRKFNSPNDLTLDSMGRIYFTDPRYGPRDTMEMRDSEGNLVEGVYRIDSPGVVHRILGSELERPNGILVSPDDQHLFVADNNNNSQGGARKLWRFDLNADGTIKPQSRKLIFDWKTSRGPDGLKMDKAGRLFVAAGLNTANPPFETVEPYPAGIYILSSDGQWLDHVPIPRDEVTNCAFGGEDFRTLYITAGGTLWSLRVDTPGQTAFSGAPR
jgi:gluconolactonase